MKFCWIGTASVALSLTVTLPSVALSVTFGDDLTDAPTFDAPDTGTPPTQTLSQVYGSAPFPYRSQAFFVNTTGAYDFSSLATGITTPAQSGTFSNWNPAIVLYENSFDPTNSLQNALFSVAPGTPTVSETNFQLIANTQYFMVTTVYNVDDGYGTFTNTINGSTGNNGTITLGEITPVPAPEASPLVALAIFGIGSWITSQRRKQRQCQVSKTQYPNLASIDRAIR